MVLVVMQVRVSSVKFLLIAEWWKIRYIILACEIDDKFEVKL